jgi:hypothetical protein
MKDLDPMVFLAVFQEMLSPVMWLLMIVAIAGFAMFTMVLVREKRLDSSRLVRSELAGLLGGALALVFTAYVTHSGFTDAGGPIDWLLVGVIFGVGLVGTTLIVYAIMGCRCGCFKCDKSPQ